MPRPGMLSVGPVALLMRGRAGNLPMQKRAIHAQPNPSVPLWRDLVGSVFLYTAANWGVVSWFVEVTMRSTSAKALARLWDVTAASAVAGSLVLVDAGASGVLLVPTRVRSSALTLTDGHEYRIQYGVQDGGAGAAIGATLIAV
jgi:hypothetical protein